MQPNPAGFGLQVTALMRRKRFGAVRGLFTTELAGTLSADQLRNSAGGYGGGNRIDVTIRTYRTCDHQFFDGSGPSTPPGCLPPQHVGRAGVTDIATWVLDH